MARDTGRSSTPHASMKPSEAKEGGSFGIPNGAEATITDVRWTTWEEAGEKAITKGRAKDDPALMIVASLEGKDEEVTEFLGAGKGSAFQPSKDGEYIDPVSLQDGEAINKSCNAYVFLDSVFGKMNPKVDKTCEAYKRHKDKMLDEDDLDAGVSKALVGLVFIAGRMVVERTFDDQPDRKNKPTLVVTEVITAPGEGKGKAKTRSRAAEPEPEPARPSSSSSSSSRRSAKPEPEPDTTDDLTPIEVEAEKAIAAIMAKPKYRNGVPQGDLFVLVYNLVKGEKDAKEISALADDQNWLTKKVRPWKLEDDLIQEA